MKQGAPPDIRSLFAQAVGHHQAGRLDEAVACYRQAIGLKPDLAAAHSNLGNALFDLGKAEEAEASYRQAIAYQPNLAGAHSNLGAMLYDQGKLDEAVACFRKALAAEPDYAEALNNLGAALCRQGELEEGEACVRRALALNPDFAGAHDNLGTLLWEQGRLEEAEASVRRALALAPNFTRALDNLGMIFKDRGRLIEAGAAYRRLLEINPEDPEGLAGLADLLAAQGEPARALEMLLHSLRIGASPRSKRILVDIVKQFRWTGDNAQARHAMTLALLEPWARPGDLARSAASLVKQGTAIGPCVAQAVQAWPGSLPAPDLFGTGGPKQLADDALLLALLTSAQNVDVELERFLTLARHILLDAAEGHGGDGGGLAFYAALAAQCFVNEYVFSCGENELRRAGELRDALAASLEAGSPVSSLRLLAVAAYFPLQSISGADRLLALTWPEPVLSVLTQQLREPEQEVQLRAAIPTLTRIEDPISRAVRTQYEENPYPRWVRIPLMERAMTVTGYLRRRFPLAPLGHAGDGIADILVAGCGTGQLALELAQSLRSRVLAVDLSLSSLAYAKRKAQESGLASIQFAQADLLELSKNDHLFDVVECSGVLHHLADPFAGWRNLLSLLRPGGYMVVGLYSEIARRGIVDAQKAVAQGRYDISAEGIRRCRQDLLASERLPAFGVEASSDFFGISSCRDLLFHVQEHRTDLPAIDAFLRESGLAFLGFETETAILRAYRRRFPDDLPATNLRNWHTFETEFPESFSGMYRFWIQNGSSNSPQH